jgi:archaemetzincin
MSEALGLVQLGSTIDYPLQILSEQIFEKFPNFLMETVAPIQDVEEAYDAFRNQYHSTRILALLEKLLETTTVGRMLGVASFDLYVPGMNFVFGEARCPGRAAVISTLRLKPNMNDSSLLGRRVLKEAVHEVGHMLGLGHCANQECVMYFSERLRDTDRKHDNLCGSCGQKLKWLRVE